jgi:hypothetical protein
MPTDVLRLENIEQEALAELLSRFGLALHQCPTGDPIPGSYWGDDEAGLRANLLYARPDSPLHSILHEAAHYICMDSDRRQNLDTDAGYSFRLGSSRAWFEQDAEDALAWLTGHGLVDHDRRPQYRLRT